MTLRRLTGFLIALLTLLSVAGLSGAGGGAVWAQGFSLSSGATRPLPVHEAFQISVLDDGRDGQGAVVGWQIKPGYYLYRDQFAAKGADGRAFQVETQPGIVKSDPAFGDVEVYFDQAQILLPDASGQAVISWQGCQDNGICYPPEQSAVTLADVMVAPQSDASQPAALPADLGLRLDAEAGGMIAALSQRGGVWLVLASFLGLGVLLAFTPCVLPMVPILTGMLAREGEGLRPARGALLSGAYVLAMASAFGLMGAVAGWSGQNLQMALQSPWAVGALAGLFVLLALSSFGMFRLELPSGLTAKLSRTGAGGRKGSVTGAAALGFTSALIVGPCVTAPLAGAFLYIAQTGDVALGAAALFALGLGHGIPLFIAGSFGASLLPRAGAWMNRISQIFGLIFLALAVWLLARLVPASAEFALWTVLLIGSGVFLGALDRLAPEAGAGPRLSAAAGVLCLLAGTLMAVGLASGASDPLRPLARLGGGATSAASETPAFTKVTSLPELEAALSQGPARARLVYFTAEWCVTCRVIERRTLLDPSVQAALKDMNLIMVDVTDPSDDARALMDMFDVAGPPSMVFLDPNRAEVAGTRMIGSSNAVTLRDAAQSAKAGRL